MDDQARFEFYERIYFHELEAREQMTTRVQIPLTLLTAIIGAIGFMLQNIERDLSGRWVFLFYSACLIAGIFVIASGIFCVRSTWGHWYRMTSFANEWDDYHKSCAQTYAGQDDAVRDDLINIAVRDAIKNKYIECATTNAEINQLRAYHHHRTVKFFLFALAFTSLAFFIYFLGGLDKSLHTKPTDIKIVSPIQLKGSTMTTRPPPPAPPPPPPTRLVRDDAPPKTKPAPPHHGK